MKRQVGVIERAWALEKGGTNFNLLLSHYMYLDKNNNPFFIFFFLMGKGLIYIKFIAQSYICYFKLSGILLGIKYKLLKTMITLLLKLRSVY